MMMGNRRKKVNRNDFILSSFSVVDKRGYKMWVGWKIIHKETGLWAECGEYLSQEKNQRKAFEKLVNSPEFQAWLEEKDMKGGNKDEEI